MSTADALLNVAGLGVGYVPGIDILRNIDLRAERGKVTTIIGPNGAGKSTLLRCIFGLLPARRGTVEFAGSIMEATAPDRRKLDGMAYVPQHHSTCPQLTIEENLRLGGWLLRRRKPEMQARLDEIYERFPVLAERRRIKATQLSGGQLRTLAVAKELIVQPRLMLLDEPSVGMSPKVAQEVYAMLAALPSQGVTVLLVDQNITDAVAMSDSVYLIAEGGVQRHGTGRWFTENISDVIREMLQGA
ncbi:ABC transporter ATP-binding protein [Bradyrhizobium mercantei]|uniref:ABC transporter ATP-binding protein n=1 Tax=Bradyrhizobium mercantei TaxID=1904807 RepID=UPI000975EDAA|nr:ATP-binding cassette domain-containing protein [Bradyrhizobium mercantei]